jgi:crotonobetainyl-CoA:carnitine CoA-transferase CaiB-like acyl-CoA transferase
VTAAPRLGQHTDEILIERLKYSGEGVAALRQQGVIA